MTRTLGGKKESWTPSLTLGSVILIASGIVWLRKLKNSLLQMPVRGLIKEPHVRCGINPQRQLKLKILYFFCSIFNFHWAFPSQGFVLKNWARLGHFCSWPQDAPISCLTPALPRPHPFVLACAFPVKPQGWVLVPCLFTEVSVCPGCKKFGTGTFVYATWWFLRQSSHI